MINKGILKWVGQEYWPWPLDHIKETRDRGPSIRISPKAVPNLDTPYPVAFVHPRGTFVLKGRLRDLLLELRNEGHILQQNEDSDYIKDGLPSLAFVHRLSQLPQKEFIRIVDKYHIEFKPAVTHYSYITGAQVVIGDEGEGLETLAELQAAGLEVEGVKVVREDE